MSIAYPKEWIFGDIREFIYKLSLCLINQPLMFYSIHTYTISNVTSTTIYIDYDHDYVLDCKIINPFYFYSNFVFMAGNNSTQYSIFVFDMHVWMDMAEAANRIHKEYYKEVYNVLSKKFPQELEENILDFLNIPHNYDWMATLMEYTKAHVQS